MADAFSRGGPIADGSWVELGSGTGLASLWLAARCRRLVAMDLSRAMLALAPPGAGMRVCGDGARLPLRDGSIDALILVNAFLFPAEARRVLGAQGWWSGSTRRETGLRSISPRPMYGAPSGRPGGVASEAGQGTWVVARRH